MTPMTKQEKKALKISAVVVPVLAVIFYFTGQHLSDRVKAYNAEKYMTEPASTQQTQTKAADIFEADTDVDKQSIRVVPVDADAADGKASAEKAQTDTAASNQVSVKTDDKGNQTVTPDWSKQPPKTELKTPSTATSASSGTASSGTTATKKTPSSSTTTTTKPSSSSTGSTTTKPKTETTKPTKPSSGSSTSSSGTTSKGDDKSLWGKTNDKGETYVPGFGWTKPGKGEVEVVEVNPNGNIIGH